MVSFYLEIFLSKMENKKECSRYLSLNSPNTKSYSPNGGVIDDLYSLDAFHIRTGERASANFKHWTCQH